MNAERLGDCGEPLFVFDASEANGPPTILDRPSSALTGGSHKSHVNGRSILSASASTRAAFSAAGVDRLTPEQCAVLMGWPRDYPLPSTQTGALHIAANGCTPPVVELLARAVIVADRQAP
tara:strand:- start:59 stop:421 length:363 start_codon:yes stop_codon:yes gene_type:complete